MNGKLFIVPTPIGNLEDITLRAINTFKEVDYILAEDTRTTSKLLNHLQISKQLRAYHQHNEHAVVSSLVMDIAAGKNVALCSDAGTPGISDPGFLLIREAVKNDIEVITLPGPTAFVPALVSSGFPCDTFTFLGFLPHKKGRQTKIKELAERQETVILYESPFRLVKLLNELSGILEAERMVCVSREISKIYEEHKRGTCQDLIQHFTEKTPKGEIVVVIEGSKK